MAEVQRVDGVSITGALATGSGYCVLQGLGKSKPSCTDLTQVGLASRVAPSQTT